MIASYVTDFYTINFKRDCPDCNLKTIEAYARAIRYIGDWFDYDIRDLTEEPLLEYFSSLLKTHSWSTVKLDLYGLKFFYQHVLHKPWPHVDLVKPPKATRLPDIVTVDEAVDLFKARSMELICRGHRPEACTDV